MSEPNNIDLTPFLEKSITRRYEIDATLTGIHGEHATRIQTIHELTYDESVTASEKNDQSTESKSKKTDRTQKKEKKEPVHTFPLDSDGNYLVPMGGAHGYLMGALRAGITDLYKEKLKDTGWEGYGILGVIGHSMIITPDWVSVGKVLEHSIEKPRAHMVEMAGVTKSMRPIYYDVVGRVMIHLVVDFTNNKIPEDIFFSLLAHTQLLGMGPKGRGVFKITKLVKTKG